MAEPENPLLPVRDKVQSIHTRLMDFLRNVLAKIRPMIRSLAGFIAEVRKSAKEIALSVGKAAVENIIKLGVRMIQVFTFIEKQVVIGIKMAIRILATIKKASAVPEKVFNVVKGMVARLAKVFRLIVVKVFEIVSVMNPIGMVLGVINTMKMMLQMVFKWIGQVGQISTGLKKAQTLMKKSAKLLKDEAKKVTALVKETNKLKPA